MTSKTGLFLSGSLTGLIGTIAIGIVNFFFRRRMSLTLSEMDYGFFYGSFALIFFLSMILDMGCSNFSTIQISKYRDNHAASHGLINSICHTSIFYKLLSGILVGGILFLSSPWLAEYYFKYPNCVGALRIMAVFFPLFCLENHMLALLWGFKSFLFGYTVNFCKYFLIWQILCFVTNDIYTAPTIFVVSSLLFSLTVIIYLFLKNKICLSFPPNSIMNMGNFLKTGLWLSIYSGISQVFIYVDSLVLTAIKGTAATGLYNIAFPIIQIAFSLLIVFPTIWTPIATSLWQSTKRERRTLENICSLFLLFTITCLWASLLIVVPLSKHIITFMFASKYVAAAKPLEILIAGIVMYVGSLFFLNAVNAKQKNFHTSQILAIATAINVVMCFVLIPRFDVAGAALAALSGYVYIFLMSLYLLKRHLPLFSIITSRSIYIMVVGVLAFGYALWLKAQNLPLANVIINDAVLLAVFLLLTLPIFLPYLPRSRKSRTPNE